MKKAIKRTFTILAAATTLLVSGASMTANAACQYHDRTYVQGRYIENFYVRGNYRYCCCCNQCTGRVYYR